MAQIRYHPSEEDTFEDFEDEIFGFGGEDPNDDVDDDAALYRDTLEHKPYLPPSTQAYHPPSQQQPLQQQQNSVNKANNTVAGKTNNSGKLGSPSSNDNTASPMDSASVTSPAVLTKEARGRVTRSSLGKAPLSLKSCEQVI